MQKAKLSNIKDLISDTPQYICDNLMVDNIHRGNHADWYCQKHHKNIPPPLELNVMALCAQNKKYDTCWAAIEEKFEKEEARKAKEKAEKEKAEINCIIADFKSALRRSPDDLEIYISRGLAFGAKGYSALQIADYTHILQQNPNHAKAYQFRALAYSIIGECNKAIEDYNSLLKLNPDDAKIYSLRGSVYFQKGEPNKAMADHNEALKLDSKCVEAYIGKAIVYGEKGKYDLAIASCKEALRLDPNNIVAPHALENAKSHKRQAKRNREEKIKNLCRKLPAPILSLVAAVLVGISMGSVLAGIMIILIPLAILHFVKSGGFFNLFRIASIILLLVMAIACFGFAMGGTIVGWIALILLIGASIMAFLKPIRNS